MSKPGSHSLVVDSNWKRFCSRKKKIGIAKIKSFKHNKYKKTDPTIGATLSNGKNILPQKYVAVDCEMVGVGKRGKNSIIARVSIVDSTCNVIYDEYVKPDIQVTDLRTHVSGIRTHDLKKGLPFHTVQSDIEKIFLISELIIGHTIKKDLACLKILLPKSRMKDISRCVHLKKLAQINGPNVVSLKSLSTSLLSKSIQTGEHSSVQDAIATMQLFLLVKDICDKDCSINTIKL